MSYRKYPPIVKARREYHGGVIFRERPAFMAHVDNAYADAYGIRETPGSVLREGVFTAPLDAHLALTTRCDLYCEGCYSVREGDEPADIKMDTAKAVMDKLSDLGVFSVSFGGGEPALHPGIFEIAVYARERSILPNMTTNGLSMTERFAGQCSVFGNVHFSIHKPCDRERVYAAMRIYRCATGKRPGLNLLLTKETLPSLESIVGGAAESGARKILLLRYKTTAKNAGARYLDADSELPDLPGRLRKLRLGAKRIMFLADCSLFEIFAESGFSDVKPYRRHDSNGCMGANAYIAIDVNGMYKPCSFWPETIGSVLDLGFGEWMHNQKLAEFRSMRRGESCASCAYAELCAGGCRLFHAPGV